MTMPKGWKSGQSPDAQPNAGHDIQPTGQEQIIWRNDVTTGIIHRKVVETQIITNMRVMRNDRSIALSDLDDIIVMNQHRESQGQSARYYVRGFGTSYGTGHSRGKTVGDVTFIYQGRPAIVFQKIDDPYGVTRLAKAARRSLISAIKMAQKLETKAEKEKERATRLVQKSESQSFQVSTKISGNRDETFVIDKNQLGGPDIVCLKCGSDNPNDAKFCGICGTSLSSSCSNCGSSNPQGASFCNKCGFALA